jgi:PadR family transcriptional regulator, regulatory protein PadR
MARNDYLGDFEHIVLLAIVRLDDNAYGTTIQQEIEARAGRSTSVGALYTVLGRLEEKGYVSSSLADPTPERGGRAKRYFKIERAGRAALKRARSVLARMWDGLEPGFDRR